MDEKRIPENKRVTVFDYLDFRKYLSDFFAEEKTRNPEFSLRYLAVKIGMPISNATFFSKLIAGTRNLTVNWRFSLCKALELTPSETDFFDLLVQYDQAHNSDAKQHFLQEIHKFRGLKERVLEGDSYHYYSKWYFSVVRAYLGLNPNEKNPDTIAKTIFPKISTNEVEEALQILLDLKLIKKMANGYSPTETHISTPRDKRDLAARNRINEFTRLGLEVFPLVSAEFREYHAMTMYISEKGYRSLKDRIRVFQDEIKQLVDKDIAEDRVYTLNLQFFPNTSLDPKGKPLRPEI